MLEARIAPSSLPDLVGYDAPAVADQWLLPRAGKLAGLGHRDSPRLRRCQLRRHAACETYNIAFYLSADSTIDTADVLLADNTGYNVPDGSSLFAYSNVALVLPATNPFDGAGPYYIGMIVNSDNTVMESNYANNSNQGSGLDLNTLAVSAGVSVRRPACRTGPQATPAIARTLQRQRRLRSL